MANTFTAATSNLGSNAVPLPGNATQASGGVSSPVPVTPGQSMSPVAPLPGQVTYAAVPL